MKYWSSGRIAGSAKVPAKVRRIADALNARFEEFEGATPTLLRIGKTDRDGDIYRWEVDVELAPGVVLPTEHDLIECDFQDWDDPAGSRQAIVSDVMEGVDACMPMMDRLADFVHEARIAARIAVAAWSAEGLASCVVDVRLSPYDLWRGDSEPALRLSLESIDDRLQHTVETIDTYSFDSLDAALQEVRHTLASLTPLRDHMARQGASCSISQLALNALAEFGDPAAYLRRFQTERRFRLPDGTAIFASCGVVEAGFVVPGGAWNWKRDSVTVAGHLVPDFDPSTAAGRSATELLDHPFLSDDITMLSTEWFEDDYSTRRLLVRLAMPNRLFCSTSGRVWDAADLAPTGDNVVPFARRIRTAGGA